MCTVPWSHMTMKWMTGLLLRRCCAPLLRAVASTQVNIISQVGLQSRGDQALASVSCLCRRLSDGGRATSQSCYGYFGSPCESRCFKILNC